jgi:hypothetical protein
LRIAAQFFDWSTDTKTFKRAMNAYNHAQFYRQLGKEPQEMVTAALRVLAKRFRTAIRGRGNHFSSFADRPRVPHYSKSSKTCRASQRLLPGSGYSNRRAAQRARK